MEDIFMVVKIVEKDDEYYQIADLVGKIKKSRKVDEAGAIFTFEGFVRGKEEDLTVKQLILTTPDKEKTEKELLEIVDEVKEKYGVYEIAVVHYIGEFYTGDTLFLVAVLGPHRNETLDALKETIERTKYDLDYKKGEISNEGTKIILAGG
jgi:molybdopterin synthase catalytic subunit